MNTLKPKGYCADIHTRDKPPIYMRKRRMGQLNNEQMQRALAVMREYLSAPQNSDGTGTPIEVQAERDGKRVETIREKLKPLVQGFLNRTIPLEEFKSKVDSLNKHHEYWGFKGVKGQMFFNMLFNRAEDSTELAEELKSAVNLPPNEDIARSRIRTFSSYVKRIGDEYVEAGGPKQGRPRTSSVPYFLSYFWQIQNHLVWPVFYTNSVNTMLDLNLWTPSEDLAADYVLFKHLQEELASLFSEHSKMKFSLYKVEHVFWFKGGNPFGGDKPLRKEGSAIGETAVSTLPESYVPPVVAILPKMAENDDKLAEVAKASGTSLERAFEKHIDAALTILGFEARLMGQGKGRVPDGLALEMDHSYGIIWDAKIRVSGYSMGTDDRTIREYIVTQSRELRRRRSLRNIYYLIVSSGFADDWEDAVRSLKMETEISEVCLAEAGAIVAMVDAKLRDPHQIGLGPDGIQRIFSTSGVITSDLVQEMMG